MRFNKWKKKLVTHFESWNEVHQRDPNNPDSKDRFSKLTIAKLKRARSVNEVIEVMVEFGFDREDAKYYLLLTAVE